MSKFLKVLIALVAVAVIATPAMAEFKLNGYYRLQGTYQSEDNSGNDDYKTMTQRIRMKMTKSLNENVGFVYYVESDLDWGGNGDVGVDDKNIETKNAYLYIKSGDYSSKLGAQGYKDIFNGLIVSEDLMAATAKFKLGAAKMGLIYAKADEGDEFTDDDTDIYGATVAASATETIKVSGGVWLVDTQAVLAANEEQIVTYGARVDAAVSEMLDVSAFALMQDLEVGDSYALSANAKVKLANGAVMLEGLYIPEADAGDDSFTQLSPFFYNGTPFMFLKRDVGATNNGEGEGKYNDNLADGVTMLSGYGQFNFNGIYAGGGVAWAEGDTTKIGTEIVGKIGKKFFGNVDCSLRAAQFSAGESADNDETKIIGMVNVSF